MRSDERDFVDDMLDDVTGGPVGGSVMASAPPAGYVAPPTNTGSGGQMFHIGGAQSGQATAPDRTGLDALLARANAMRIEASKQAAARAAGQQGFSRGYTIMPAVGAGPLRPGATLSTPGVGGSGVPGLETHAVAVTAIPGEEGQGVGDMAASVAAVTDPRLRSILGSLRAMRIQSQATSEHAALAAQDKFRKDVTSRLARIESRLPAGGLRNQVSLVRSRIIPIMLG